MDADSTDNLLTAFRAHYYRFVQLVENSIQSPTDSNQLHRLGDQIDEFSALVGQVSFIISTEAF